MANLPAFLLKLYIKTNKKVDRLSKILKSKSIRKLIKCITHKSNIKESLTLFYVPSDHSVDMFKILSIKCCFSDSSLVLLSNFFYSAKSLS